MRGSSKTNYNLYVGGCTEIAWNMDSDKCVRSGKLDGNPVQVLLNTGSTLRSEQTTSGVSSWIISGRLQSWLQCVHGDCVDNKENLAAVLRACHFQRCHRLLYDM